MNKIAVIGSGYVGLVTGTCFAEAGNQVICVDNNNAKVESMKNGKVPIYEPKLDNMFRRNTKEGRLQFTSNLDDALKKSEIIFLALPTPPDKDFEADLSFVTNVSFEIGKLIKEYKVIVNKSTVPVGTADIVKQQISKNAKCDFDVVSNPEFLREGLAIDDFMKPERIVVGTSSQRAKEIMENLYKPFITNNNQLIFMDEKSSELTKYAANSFLATKISFMNEIANYCEIVGADVDMVRIGIGSDSRIGTKFLYPGIGYGGSCFPKDVKALVKSGKNVDYDFKILDAVNKANDYQKTILVHKLKKYFENINNLKVAIWGLAFKPETDDIREAPSINILDELLDNKANIFAYDPEAMDNIKQKYDGRITFGTNPYQILENADVLLIATEWQVFRNPDFTKIKGLMKNPIIFDGRNIYDIEEISKYGFYYNSIGRKTFNI